MRRRVLQAMHCPANTYACVCVSVYKADWASEHANKRGAHSPKPHAAFVAFVRRLIAALLQANLLFCLCAANKIAINLQFNRNQAKVRDRAKPRAPNRGKKKHAYNGIVAVQAV